LARIRRDDQGHLTAEFASLEMSIIVENPKFPGMDTIVRPAGTAKGATARAAPNYSRDHLRVMMRLDAGKMDLGNPALPDLCRNSARTNDFPIVWARQYGKGRVFYSSFGHEDDTMDDPGIQNVPRRDETGVGNGRMPTSIRRTLPAASQSVQCTWQT